MAKNTAVFGIYSHRANAENAVDLLRAAGYRNTDISVLFAENEGTKDFALRRALRRPKASPPALARAR